MKRLEKAESTNGARAWPWLGNRGVFNQSSPWGYLEHCSVKSLGLRLTHLLPMCPVMSGPEKSPVITSLGITATIPQASVILLEGQNYSPFDVFGDNIWEFLHVLPGISPRPLVFLRKSCSWPHR